MARRWGAGTVVIPAPIEVDALMNRVTRGKVAKKNELRQALAQRHHVSIGCHQQKKKPPMDGTGFYDTADPAGGLSRHGRVCNPSTSDAG